MTLPFALPDWMPGWLLLALVIPALLWFLAFLMVPFNVFGVKARLEALEAALDELNEELRVSQMRTSTGLPTALRGTELYDDVPHFSQLKRSQPDPMITEPAPPPARPPIPVAQPRGGFSPREKLAPRERPAAAPPPRPRRTEPRLD